MTAYMISSSFVNENWSIQPFYYFSLYIQIILLWGLSCLYPSVVCVWRTERLQWRIRWTSLL